MTSFTYYPTIPNAPDNPSFDQPLMQVNSQSINSILAVDHVTFNTTGPTTPSAGQSGGQHLQVSFNSKNVPGALPTDPVSVMYTNNGTASPVSQVFYQNQNGTFQISPIKAWAFTDGSGNIVSGQSSNIASIVHSGTGQFAVTLTANSVFGNAFAVLTNQQVATFTKGLTVYQITGTAQFTIFCTAVTNTGSHIAADPVSLSFMVLQI